MLTTAQRATTAAPTPQSPPRLLLAPVRANRAVLDGGWWPRSRDPVAELPGLILALSTRYGTIRQLMLNSATWDSRFRRRTVGADVVRVGWFASVDPALVIATTYDGDQIDLLVVPPGTAATTAEKAMIQAADPANLTLAQAIPTAEPATPTPVRGDSADGQPVWDNEGGRTRRARPPASQSPSAFELKTPGMDQSSTETCTTDLRRRLANRRAELGGRHFNGAGPTRCSHASPWRPAAVRGPR